MNPSAPKLYTLLIFIALSLLIGCKHETASRPVTTLNPNEIESLIKRSSIQRKELDAWAQDIHAVLDALRIAPDKETVCAVISVVEQESNFNADPKVAGLASMVKRRFQRTKQQPLLYAGLQVRLSMGHRDKMTFSQSLERVQTERDLENWYADFTASSLTKPALLLLEKDIDSLIATIGSMQVSVNFAREHAARNGIVHRNIRKDLYTRYWGLYYGTAHLLDYERPYSDWKYVFADFNAGHFASRNAAFQKMLSQLSKTTLSLDGDLLNYDDTGNKRSKTYETLVAFAAKQPAHSAPTPEQIYRDLRKEKSQDLSSSETYMWLSQIYAKKYGRALTETLPEIRLQSDKIRRQLTTAWFANRVNGRHQRCMKTKI